MIAAISGERMTVSACLIHSTTWGLGAGALPYDDGAPTPPPAPPPSPPSVPPGPPGSPVEANLVVGW